METNLGRFIEGSSPAAAVIISVALMLISGFAMTRLTKKLRLPNVTAYIVTGIILGKYVLGAVPDYIVSGMDFLSDIAVAFIAFSTGEFFRLEALRKNGAKVIVITLFETMLASALMFIFTYFVLGLPLVFSIVLSAIASATAPASTMMTIRQTGAKGDFVDTLLQVVALDDIIGLIAYSIAISIALATMGDGVTFGGIVLPVVKNIAVMALGGAFGFLMKLLMPKKRSNDNRLIISISVLFTFCGICALLDISPLLGCMSMGTVYINITNDEKLFMQLGYFSPPVLLLFFVRSGLNFNLGVLFAPPGEGSTVPIFVIVAVYFAVRMVGKYAGAFIGCAVVGKSAKVRANLGLALFPQASVAIGLAALAARELAGETGLLLETVILSTSVLYELFGPALAKLSLYLAGSYSDKLEDIVPVAETKETGEAKSSLEMLIERIQKIESELPPPSINAENEQAFTEAAEEHRREMMSPMFRRRRR